MTPQSLPPRSSPAVVFGEALFDEFGQEVVAGGAPYNVARHLAGLGVAPLMVTRVGSDARGADIVSEMRLRGMSTAGVQVDSQVPTGRVTVRESEDGHAFLIEPDAAWDFIEAQGPILEQAACAPWLYFGTLALRSSASRGAWRKLCLTHRGQRYLDLNWRAGQLAQETASQALDMADLLKVSEVELKMLLGWHGTNDVQCDQPATPGSECAAIARVLAAHGIRRMIVTYGVKGYAAYDWFGRCTQAGRAVPAARTTDTVGAGDAFSSIVLLGLVRGWDWAATLRRANEFAAGICEIRGAVPRDVAYYETWRHRWNLT